MDSAETRTETLIIKTTIHDIMNKMIQVCILIWHILCVNLIYLFFPSQLLGAAVLLNLRSSASCVLENLQVYVI